MIAGVPPLVVEVGVWLGTFTAMIVFASLVWRTPPMQWLTKQLREDREDRMLAAVKAGTADIVEALEDHRKYMHYHLGPNGETKPIHQRLCDLESAAGVED